MHYLDFAPSELSFFKVQAEGLFLVTPNVALGSLSRLFYLFQILFYSILYVFIYWMFFIDVL